MSLFFNQHIGHPHLICAVSTTSPHRKSKHSYLHETSSIKDYCLKKLVSFYWSIQLDYSVDNRMKIDCLIFLISNQQLWFPLLDFRVGGYYKLTPWLDKKYISVALVQSERFIQPATTLWLANTIPCLGGGGGGWTWDCSSLFTVFLFFCNEEFCTFLGKIR